MKVYKLEVFVIDYNRKGIDQIISSIEDSGEDFSVKVTQSDFVTVDWNDDHPLNKTSASRDDFMGIFKND